MGSIYDFSAKKMNGQDVSLEEYKGKVLVVVNTASKCGFTPQYEDLQKIYERYNEKGFTILGFPCNQFGEQEPGENEEVAAFCQLNYGVTFPMFNKVEVRGEGAHPLFQYLTSVAPFQGMEHNVSAKVLKGKLEQNFPHLFDGDSIKWNFTKFLIDRDGDVVKRFEPSDSPLDMETDIEKLL